MTPTAPDPAEPPDPDRFPGYDVLSQSAHWDRATQGVVLSRIGPQPALRFFTPAEQATAAALFDLLLNQGQPTDPRPPVPVLQMVDARLAELQTDGWRYADMPSDDQAWQRSLTALDLDAQHHCDAESFAALPREQQAARLEAVQGLGDKHWYGLPASHVWSLWTRYACTAYYAHPQAWSEIGFGGPAYPRGYLRLGVDAREPWEVADRAPADDPVPHRTPGESA
ncbi:gluconate 2-dehydrogenase subunit 3 family protein [Streptacidiphilus sp. PB12-B1b]|uniref:gluconate 2-dehydrogenase subunit 3 family protein n=1 Tax=Streptacidiphilus sp. PB12-B1b TaxID=2705012 RepID=UPI0015FCC491|nr:gluconate 2-dehydrogenase subunit 3 family protein [Streptacidiphilus sp. PB12-B1b]QMU76707.1 gluconate 2-dehydrogenase subunit 3 family protein [Streptacidiphilus sp. PB12-B1b]